MSGLGPRARKLITQRLDEYVEEADSVIVENEVAVADDGAGETLVYISEAAASAYHAADCTRSAPGEDDGPVHEQMDDAYFAALEALSEYVEQWCQELNVRPDLSAYSTGETVPEGEQVGEHPRTGEVYDR